MQNIIKIATKKQQQQKTIHSTKIEMSSAVELFMAEKEDSDKKNGSVCGRDEFGTK